MRVPPKLLFLLRLALICLSVVILSLPLAGRADAPDGGAAVQLAQAEQPPAEGGEEAEPVAEPPPIDSGDTAWMLTSTALVLLMTIPGLALFYGGMVRKMNVLSVLMQVFAICCTMSIAWMVLGYSLAFAEGGAYVGGLDRDAAVRAHDRRRRGHHSRVGVHDLPDDLRDHHPGADRRRLRRAHEVLGHAGLHRAVVAHRLRADRALGVGTGRLPSGDGVLDFAGGTVVHINAGVAGLVCALVLGKRRGYGREPMPPHNLTLSLIGASLLWVGWFGFNAGSAAAANGRAGMAMAVTQIATAAAALAWMFAEWLTRSKPSLLGIISGAIGGLVAITPAAGFVLPGGALVIGIAAGIACFWAATWLKNALGYDDSLDVFGVHGIGGIVGALLTGVFAVEAVGGAPGLLEGNPGQVLTQLWGIAATIVWCGVASV